MPNYDFKSLSPIDFEALARDLLQSELGIRLESFKPGKDQGIDLRHFLKPDQSLIVQCKHYASTGFIGLRNHLKTSELAKIRKLKPVRYLLATTVPLSPANKGELLKLLEPYVKDAGDIYGAEDLNNLLGRHPRIEKEHIKLWLSGVNVLDKILHSKIWNATRDEIERIVLRSRLYVYNSSFKEGINILDARNVCLIAGIPGIGKTTLAEMLVLHYVRSGYELVRISSDIDEATEVDHGAGNRIYYYDDFLGQSSGAEMFAKNEDQRLLRFIDKVSGSKHMKLILTTREYILATAKKRYERMAHRSFDLETCIVDMSKYTRRYRSEILFNHVFFSDLPHNFIDALVRERGFLKIVDHPNYNPRYIESMTSLSRLGKVTSDKYLDFFLNTLDDPSMLWGHVFENQLSEAARSLLIVLTTLPRYSWISDLEDAFNVSHRERCRSCNTPVNSNDFQSACKELDGNFVKFAKFGGGHAAEFYNPSIRDYVQEYCSKHPNEIVSMLGNVYFFEQLIWIATFQDEKKVIPFMEIIRSNQDVFCKRLKEVFINRSCETMAERYTKLDGTTYLQLKNVNESTVARLEALVRLYLEHSFLPLEDFISSNIGKVISELNEIEVDDESSAKEEMLSLTEELRKLTLKDFSILAVFFWKVEEWLSDSLESIHDINFLLEFKKSSKVLAITSREKEKIVPLFHDLLVEKLSDYRVMDRGDSDEVRDLIRVVKDITVILRLDYKQEMHELDDIADRFESDRSGNAIIPRRKTEVDTVEATDAEIVSLFQSMPERA